MGIHMHILCCHYLVTSHTPLCSTRSRFPIHGRKEADIRKLIFGGFEEECALSIQLPGMVQLQEVYVPRMHMRLHAEEGDDAWYCDGWSEKQFDMDQAAMKCVGWIGNNALDLAGDDQGDTITGEFPSVPEPDGYPTGSDEGVDVGGVPESQSRVLQPGSFHSLPPPSPSAESRDKSNPASSLSKQPLSGGWGSDEGAILRGDLCGRSEPLSQYGQQSRESVKAAAVDIHHAGGGRGGGGGIFAGAAAAAAEQSRVDDNAALQELDALMTQTSTDILAKYANARNHFDQQVCTACSEMPVILPRDPPIPIARV